MNPAEFAFKLLSDMYGIENMDTKSFMDIMARLDEPLEFDFSGDFIGEGLA